MNRWTITQTTTTITDGTTEYTLAADTIDVLSAVIRENAGTASQTDTAITRIGRDTYLNISSKLDKILSSKKCVICELMIDPEQDQKPKAINRREAGKTIPTDFEDLYPFISRKELEENNFEFVKKNIL